MELDVKPVEIGDFIHLLYSNCLSRWLTSDFNDLLIKLFTIADTFISPCICVVSGWRPILPASPRPPPEEQQLQDQFGQSWLLSIWRTRLHLHHHLPSHQRHSTFVLQWTVIIFVFSHYNLLIYVTDCFALLIYLSTIKIWKRTLFDLFWSFRH